MEKIRSIKEQQCIKMMDYLHPKNWVKWNWDQKASNYTQCFTLFITINLSNIKSVSRTEDAFDKLINDKANFSNKNQRKLIVNFTTQTCEWEAHYLLNNYEEVLSTTGTCAWNDELIDAIHEYLMDKIKLDFRYSAKDISAIRQQRTIEIEQDLNLFMEAKLINFFNDNINICL